MVPRIMINTLPYFRKGWRLLIITSPETTIEVVHYLLTSPSFFLGTLRVGVFNPHFTDVKTEGPVGKIAF